jgi:hypothetical protein
MRLPLLLPLRFLPLSLLLPLMLLLPLSLLLPLRLLPVRWAAGLLLHQALVRQRLGALRCLTLAAWGRAVALGRLLLSLLLSVRWVAPLLLRQALV